METLTLYSAEAIIMLHQMIWSWYTGRWRVGCYIWYSEKRTGRGRSPSRPLLAVPNVTAHQSTASVPITVLLYNGPLLTRDIDIAILSVCPSRSGIRWKSLTYCHNFSPYGSPIIFLQHQTSSRNSDGVTPCGGAKYRWNIKISRFSTNKSLYLADDTR